MGVISDALKKNMGGALPSAMDDTEPDAEDPMEMDEGEDESAMDDKASIAATKQVLKAIKSGDATSLRDALKTLINCC